MSIERHIDLEESDEAGHRRKSAAATTGGIPWILSFPKPYHTTHDSRISFSCCQVQLLKRFLPSVFFSLFSFRGDVGWSRVQSEQVCTENRHPTLVIIAFSSPSPS